MSLSDSFLDPESLDPPECPAADSAAQSEGPLDFEIRFYDAILRGSPDFVDVLRCQAELYSRKRDHARALEIDQRLVRLCPDDCVVRYNLACSLALDHRPQEALVQLRCAFERGYTDVAHLESDHDLESVRELPEYAQLLGEFTARA